MEDGGFVWATLEFRRRINAPTLAYQVLESADLLTWSPVADAIEMSREPTSGQPGIETVRLVIWPPLDPQKPCFLRLHLSSHEAAQSPKP